MNDWKLIGGYKYVRGWFGHLVLLVHEETTIRNPYTLKNETITRWRKARFSDLKFLREHYGNKVVEND